MALITCPECGKEISDKAVACPHCGNPINSAVVSDVKNDVNAPSTPDDFTRIPSKVKWYYLVRIAGIFALITFPAIFAQAWGGFFWSFFILFGIPIWIFVAVQMSQIKYKVSNMQITAAGGVFSTYSRSVPFIQAQNVVTSSGIIMRFFDLERLSVWTASPSQISIREGNSSNRPDISLLLNKADAEDIKKQMVK